MSQVYSLGEHSLATELWDRVETDCPDEFYRTVQDAQAHGIDIIRVFKERASEDRDTLVTLLSGDWSQVVRFLAEFIPPGSNTAPFRDHPLWQYMFLPAHKQPLSGQRYAKEFVEQWQKRAPLGRFGPNGCLKEAAAVDFLRDEEYALTVGEAEFLLHHLARKHNFRTGLSHVDLGPFWKMRRIDRGKQVLYQLVQVSR